MSVPILDILTILFCGFILLVSVVLIISIFLKLIKNGDSDDTTDPLVYLVSLILLVVLFALFLSLFILQMKMQFENNPYLKKKLQEKVKNVKISAFVYFLVLIVVAIIFKKQQVRKVPQENSDLEENSESDILQKKVFWPAKIGPAQSSAGENPQSSAGETPQSSAGEKPQSSAGEISKSSAVEISKSYFGQIEISKNSDNPSMKTITVIPTPIKFTVEADFIDNLNFNIQNSSNVDVIYKPTSTDLSTDPIYLAHFVNVRDADSVLENITLDREKAIVNSKNRNGIKNVRFYDYFSRQKKRLQFFEARKNNPLVKYSDFA